jgi:hypothetical protein
MDGLRRRNWLLDSRYRLLTYGFGVRSDLPAVARIVPQLLGSFEWKGIEGRTYSLLRDGEGENPFAVRTEEGDLFRTATSLGLIDEMLWHVNREAIAGADPYLAIHSAAAEREGSAVILPAAQDSGKSTLVAGLVRAGFHYLTDEAALIDGAAFEVEPYPKPLWLSPPSVLAMDGLRDRVIEDYRHLDRIRTYVRPVDLGGQVGFRSPVCLVVSPRFVPAHQTLLEPLSRAATLMCLAENAFNLPQRGAEGMGTLRGVVERAPGYRLAFSDLGDAVRTVHGLLSEVLR